MSDDMAMKRLLGAMKGLGASDLHLKVGMPPYYRVGGHLRSAKGAPLTGEQIDEIITPIIPEGRRAHYEENGDLDFSTEIAPGERFRVNIFRAGTKMNAAIRRVNAEIPSYEELHLPPVYEQLIDKSREGIIIVSGVTGCGKSTTLAAMIEHINRTRRENIVTIEDPIEFLFRPKKSIVSQREIGIDIASYGDGLKYVVRQDPDVIFIGEMRDKFTMNAAVQAAETGHLVFGSLHTADAMQAFARILEFFPRTEHEFIRGALSNALRGICAQRLMPGCQEDCPRVPATEVLLNTPTCRELIRKEQDEDIPALIASSEGEGMHSFTMSLSKLVKNELIFRDTAMKYAPNPDALASQLRGITTQAQSMVSRVRGTGK
ncbi:MAG: PilT/PilU family type 4a pilus ATPase [Phycisphaerae bacterium]|nr:PilT/PilU family type 4a pilus ATPase [Phycisphaerae bacterium]